MENEKKISRVVGLLDEKKIDYKILTHESPAYTCEEAAKLREVSLLEMVKCMVFIDKKTKKCIVASVLADQRVSLAKLRKIVNVKSFDFAGPEQIQEMTSFPKGSVAPIGLPDDVISVIDNGVFRKKKVNISAGIPTMGVEMSSWNLRQIYDGVVGEISE